MGIVFRMTKSCRPGVTLEELQAVPSHSQFMLINNTQQQSDDYVTYTGIKIKDLLIACQRDFQTALSSWASNGSCSAMSAMACHWRHLISMSRKGRIVGEGPLRLVVPTTIAVA